jgi:signal transduction histidine kinase
VAGARLRALITARIAATTGADHDCGQSRDADRAGLLESHAAGPFADLFADVAERFKGRAAAADRTISVDDSDLAVEGDRLRLEQALTNLVDNSLRHGDGTVQLWARAAAGRVELHVSDQGAGFAPGFVERAFERFSRADEARARGGSGLGLAIVETIAAAHGGIARATNCPGGGADVWIEIAEAPGR